MSKLKYKRILLKLSGEVFGRTGGFNSAIERTEAVEDSAKVRDTRRKDNFDHSVRSVHEDQNCLFNEVDGTFAESSVGIDGEMIIGLAKEVHYLQKLGCQVGIVIGGGNFWRYRDSKHLKLDRVVSDNIGMLATIMNALAFEEALKVLGAEVRAVSSFPAEKALETYNPKSARHDLDKGRIVIFAGGTGSPFFTTDSAAALRALEMNCEVLLKATKVDYVYDKDPLKHKDAKKYTNTNYQEILEKKLDVMDLTCASLCKEGRIPMIVFNLGKKGNIEKAVKGDKIGTFVNWQ